LRHLPGHPYAGSGRAESNVEQDVAETPITQPGTAAPRKWVVATVR